MAEGEFHESLNLASLWRLPVLFVCENNLYAMGTALDAPRRRPTSRTRPPATACRARRSTAWTSWRSRSRRAAPSAQVRETGVPCLLECRTYRFRAHSMFDAQLYRDKAEIEAWRQRDPIQRLQAWLAETGMLHGGDDRRASRQRSRRRSTPRSPSPRPAPWEPVEDLERFAIMDRVPQ